MMVLRKHPRGDSHGRIISNPAKTAGTKSFFALAAWDIYGAICSSAGRIVNRITVCTSRSDLEKTMIFQTAINRIAEYVSFPRGTTLASKCTWLPINFASTVLQWTTAPSIGSNCTSVADLHGIVD